MSHPILQSFARCPGSTTWAAMYLVLCSFAARFHRTVYQNTLWMGTPTRHVRKGSLGVDIELDMVSVCIALARMIHMFALSILGGKTFAVLSPIRMMQQMVAYNVKEPISRGDLWRHNHNPCSMLEDLRVFSTALLTGPLPSPEVWDEPL